MIEIHLERRITVTDAEKVVQRLAVAHEYIQPVRLNCSSTESIEIGAGSRIGNALRRFRGVGIEVIVSADDVNDPEQYFSKNWVLFSRSGLGLALATHATTILAATNNVTKLFRDRFLKRGLAIDQNLIVASDLHKDIVAFDIENKVAFDAAFISYFPKLNAPDSAFDKDALSQLMELCREGMANLKDHSSKSPLPQGENILSYFSMGYHQNIYQASDEVGPFKFYLRTLKEKQNKLNRELLGYLEVVVNDDGVGVAARQCQDADIYWQSAEKEEEFLLKALTAGVSVKPISKDAIIRGDPGFGFNVMASELRKLRGFASIRTGRYLLVCDGTRMDPLSTAFKIAKGGASGHLHYIPGTTIQAVIPIFSPQHSFSLK